MSRITDDHCMLIGLSKIVADNGDGMIPELLQRLSERQRDFDDRVAILHSRDDDRPPSMESGSSSDNVILFPGKFNRSA